MAQTYISLGLGPAVVGFGTGDLGGRIRVHFVLQLCDLLRQLLQGLHDVGPLLGLHPPVLLQAVYQGLEEYEERRWCKKVGKENMREKKGRGVLPSDTRSASVTSLASSFSCPAGVLTPPK